MARDSEIDSEAVTRFDLSLHVFVSRLFGWTLLEGAVRGARCSKKKRKKKKYFCEIYIMPSFAPILNFFSAGPANGALQECPTEKA